MRIPANIEVACITIVMSNLSFSVWNLWQPKVQIVAANLAAW